MTLYDIAIIGAGPAGLFCAIQAAQPGCSVLLLEKNKKPGTKLLLSGSGQCNITHCGDVKDFISHYGDHGKLIKPALFGFSNRDLIRFFRERGVSMIAENNGKVFPKTRNAADVLAVLLQECRELGADLHCEEPVTGVIPKSCGFEIETPVASHHTRVLVITTGGASYPRTGSSGDGYRFSESLGQPVTKIAPALTPLRIRNFPFAALSGMSFESLHFSVWRDGRKLADHTGDVLFTHLGLSGPGILDASRNIQSGDMIRLSFVGNLNQDDFAGDLKKRTEDNRNCQVSTLLAAYPIPERLNRMLLKISGIPSDLKCAHFSASGRSKLIMYWTASPMTIEEPGDYSIAMVTRGGIALDGVNLKTMESKINPNLYFAGEVLDIDGDSGGYNLQAAFSTGFLAAQSIRKRWEL